MKHIYKYLFVPVIILTGFACSDDLLDKQPLDKFSEASVWEDLNLVETYVNNQYKVLPN